MPPEMGFVLVLFYDEAPPPHTPPSDDHKQAVTLTARLASTHGSHVAIRTLLNRVHASSYAVVRMSSVLSKVWRRPFFDGPGSQADTT